MKAIALDLASKLHAYADELTEECVYGDCSDESILDTVFDVVNRLKTETLSRYSERVITSYEDIA